MASTFRQFRGAMFLSGCACGLVIISGFVFYRALSTGRQVLRNSDAGSPVTLLRQGLDLASFSPDSLRILVATQLVTTGVTSTRAGSRYRLAGTFAVESGTGQRDHKAIVDDTVSGEQRIVGEGDRIEEALVLNIARERMRLQTGSEIIELSLDFAAGTGGKSGNLASTDTNAVTLSAGVTNRFGCVRVRDDRWQFTRQPLLDYYQELLDEPDRMVAVFDSLKPVRDSSNRITGYMLGVEGEKEFFEAVGLIQGDIIRQVNSVAMTNRRRAEFFIDEFLKNRMNAIVLDVERDGQRRRQVYQVQE